MSADHFLYYRPGSDNENANPIRRWGRTIMLQNHRNCSIQCLTTGRRPYMSRLFLADAALLAAVLPNPKQLRASDPSPYVRQRQNWILGQMQGLRRDQWLKLLD